MNDLSPPSAIYDGIRGTKDWFEKAVPVPLDSNIHTQIGVHFEEVGEMIETIQALDLETQKLKNSALFHITQLAEHLKGATQKIMIHPSDRVDFLDAICDQIVTGVGAAYMLRMDVVGALNEVNASNFSKFDDNGNPIFDENLKLAKGPNYRKADLTDFAV